MMRRRMMKDLGPLISAQYIEAESGRLGANWTTGNLNPGVPSDAFIQCTSFATVDPVTVADEVLYEFNTEAGTYHIWIFASHGGTSADSFFTKMDSGVWQFSNNMNGIVAVDTRIWHRIWVDSTTATPRTWTLTEGHHVFRLGRREPIRIDKLYITKNGDTPV